MNIHPATRIMKIGSRTIGPRTNDIPIRGSELMATRGRGVADEGARRSGATTAWKASRPWTRATRGSRGAVLEVSRRRSTARYTLTGTLKILLRIRPVRAFTWSPGRTVRSTLRFWGMRRLATTGRGAGMTAGGAGMGRGGRVMLRRLLVSLFFFFIARESQRGTRHSESKQQSDCAPYRFRGSGL
jgi:hypothetical protein